MSFQAYLDTIREKTGKGPDDFRALAAERGLVGPGVKAGDVVTWLATDFGLGRGHAMAIYSILKADAAPRPTAADRVDAQFSGAKAHWRPAFDAIVAHARTLGDDVELAPTDSYVSLVRGDRKFAIVAVTAKRLDLGVKLKGADPGARFEPAGSWNSMVTHRARIADPAEIDADLLARIDQAYSEA
ncbi:DUF4287 domain-containing protein [Herbiconiux moechotypicola]|uniref:DUF5655 domain-containing protein n=1 Tax=Herbiconiux moechotypicola TaxID=637393 RepID=A0ABN3DND8_9MICO|nr:DUF4287 domain-containing protein [Herbiconiux moechotypicola]MCS5730342.1 DUF4287 domain-containing protein [Herbiconiux moechotypicola]